eukprot:365706-Chlamydomonas_euryale.AAC.17
MRLLNRVHTENVPIEYYPKPRRPEPLNSKLLYRGSQSCCTAELVVAVPLNPKLLNRSTLSC